MNITECRYLKNEMGTKNCAIRATIDGIEMNVPLDSANTHYAEIMRQVEEGELTIQEVDTE